MKKTIFGYLKCYFPVCPIFSSINNIGWLAGYNVETAYAKDELG